MSSSNYCFLTCIQVSQEAGQIFWYSHLFQNFPQFIVIHTVKGFGIVKKAEIDVFLELSCFFDDPTGVGNLISGFMKWSLVFPFLLFSSISLCCPLRKAFLYILAILWNSAFKWEYLSFSPLLFASLLFTAIYKATSDNHFAFLHFCSMGMILIPVSCTMSWTSVHSSSGTLSIRSSPLNLFLTSTVQS